MTKGEKIGKFWFSAAMPDEVKDSCKDLLVKNDYLIPSWCNEVRIYWDCAGDDNDGALAAAYVETNYAYRYAAMYICPPFLSEELEDRDIRIKHELCHIVSSPLVSYVRDTVNILGKDENLSQLVSRESSEKVEAMTEDLSYIILEIEKRLTSKDKGK